MRWGSGGRIRGRQQHMRRPRVGGPRGGPVVAGAQRALWPCRPSHPHAWSQNRFRGIRQPGAFGGFGAAGAAADSTACTAQHSGPVSASRRARCGRRERGQHRLLGRARARAGAARGGRAAGGTQDAPVAVILRVLQVRAPARRPLRDPARAAPAPQGPARARCAPMPYAQAPGLAHPGATHV